MPRQYNRISSDDPANNNTNNASTNNTNAGTSPSRLCARSPSTCSQTSTSSISSSQNPANKSIGQRITDKIHAAVWVLFGGFVAKGTNTPLVLLSSPPYPHGLSHAQPIRPLLLVAMAQLTANFILLLYLGLYLPKVKGLKDPESWSVYCPRVIPIMTANGVVCAFFLIRSLWPVWGFLTPFILGVEAMGLLFSMHFIPWFSN